MKTSQRGLNLIKEFEGLFLHDYDDGVGVRTIGYGHTNSAGPPEVTRGMTITKQEANDILADDLADVEQQVSKLVKVPLTQNQFDALVSFHFNTGGLGRSSALKLINSGQYSSGANALLLWNKGGGKVMAGLVRRRQAEVALFKSPIRDDPPAPPDVEKPAPQHDPVPQLHWFIRALNFVFRTRG